MLDIQYCQAVTVPWLLSLHSTPHNPLYAMFSMCCFGVCLSAVTVGCDLLSKSESLGDGLVADLRVWEWLQLHGILGIAGGMLLGCLCCFVCAFR
jgi:hypothetical protein